LPHFSWWRIVLVGALASVLGACARGPEAMLQPVNLLQPVNPMVVRDHPGADLSQYTTIQVIVEPYQGGAVPDGFEGTSATFRREFSDNLRASGKFAVAETETQGGKTLEARLSIDALNYVHGAARGTTGILAGRAVLNATLTLRDKETGAVIDVIRGSHASSHAHGVFGATTGRQVTAIAKEFSSRLVVGRGNVPAAASPTVAAPVAAVPTSRAEPTDSGVEDHVLGKHPGEQRPGRLPGLS
jgi:hypothetical protein